jgi:glutathione S-transferase
MPTYKLTYFNVRGLAEVSRFMFAAAKQEYEDFRFNFSIDMKDGKPDFSTMKRPEFDAAKAAGELDPAGGKVPILTVDGVNHIGQSKAIERYLAKALGLAGSSDVEAAQIDAIAETVRDIMDSYQKVKGEEATKEKFFAEDLPASLKLMEKMLPSGQPGPFLIGSKISYADICVYRFLAAPKGFFDDVDKAKAAYSGVARIAAAMEAVEANAEIQAWIAKRPETMM